MTAIGLHPLAQATNPRAWWLDALGGAAVLAFAWLAWLSHERTHVPLASLFAVLGIAWFAMLAAWWLSARVTEASLLRRLWIWAVLLRVAGFFGEPVLEDDYWRYLWDGRTFALTGNPYARPPLSSFNDPAVPQDFQRVLDNINHPDIPTVYGPGCQYAFLFSYWIAPGQLWPLKLFLIAADLLTLWLLLSLVSPRNALLYAWCSLLLQETAFTAHPDSLAILFAVAALVGSRKQRWLVASLCLGLAVTTRVFAWLLVPYVLWRMPWKHWLAFAGTIALMNLPFWLRGTAPGLEGTSAFLRGWEFNATVYAALQWVLNPTVAKAACAAGFFGVYLACWWHWKRKAAIPFQIPRGELIFGAFFLLSAVVNPWYLLWLLPFVALRPTATGVVALIAVSLSYAHGLHIPESRLAPYQVASWVRPAELGAVLLAALWDQRRALLFPAKRKAD